MSRLAAEKLSIGYGSRLVASGIDLVLAEGTVTCLLGPNGIGKTTLFRTLLGLLPSLAGTIKIAGDDISGLSREAIARQIAYVPQSYFGNFAYTVLDLVVMGRTAYLGNFGTPAKSDIEIAARALETLGISTLAARDVTRVSGGERQLALIARALAQQTGIIVMDEPTASLDLGNRLLVLEKVRGLADEGLAVLISTHEPEQAFAIADRVAILGGGNHFRTGPVETVLTSRQLTLLYGIDLDVEKTPSGRRVVSRARRVESGRGGREIS
jgi:iron complex transport system ATP-binding protein